MDGSIVFSNAMSEGILQGFTYGECEEEEQQARQLARF